jgi:hypothetical protein
VIQLEILEKPIKEPRAINKDRKPKVDQKVLISFSIKSDKKIKPQKQ